MYRQVTSSDRTLSRNKKKKLHRLLSLLWENFKLEVAIHSAMEQRDASYGAEPGSESGTVRDDSDSEGKTSIPRSSSRGAGNKRRNTGQYFTDYSYLNSFFIETREKENRGRNN